MESTHSIPGMNYRQQVSVVAIGLITVIAIGLTACIAIVLALLFLVIHFMLLAIQAFVEVASAISSTYSAADPLVQFLIIITGAYILYRVYRSLKREVKA